MTPSPKKTWTTISRFDGGAVVTDLGPNKKKIAQLFRMLSSSGSERRNAFAALERTMQSEGIDWSDIGNWIEHGPECNDGKFTEAELQEFGQAMRAEGVEAGIKIGMARASNSGGNGHLTLPKPPEMAEYCHGRLGQLKDTSSANSSATCCDHAARTDADSGAAGIPRKPLHPTRRENLMLEPNPDQIEIFVNAIFRHAQDGFVSLRAFVEGSNDVFRKTPIKVVRNNLKFLCDAA